MRKDHLVLLNAGKLLLIVLRFPVTPQNLQAVNPGGHYKEYFYCKPMMLNFEDNFDFSPLLKMGNST